MAFITYPLNNIDYTAEDAELFHCTRTSGIWAENSFQISVTGADNNVTIGKGIAWINNEEFSGKVAALKSAEVLDLGISDGIYPRIDVIAIQYSANNNATDVIIKKGTPATNPVRPAIVRSGAVYELYLASVYRPAGATAITASNITDLRMDETVCGLMADSVTKVDMTAIEAQVRNLINNLQNEIDEVKNLSGLMFETEWTEGGVIPVSKGGTGGNTKEQAQEKLGFAIKKLLWENATPTSEFSAAGVGFSSMGADGYDDYDEVEIVFCLSTSAVSPYISLKMPFVAGLTGYCNEFGSVGTNGSYVSFYTRTARIVNKNSIEFGVCQYKTANSTAVGTLNTVLIPRFIYGIKGVQ